MACYGFAEQGLGDKFDGFKEQIKGKVTRNPDLVQHGKEQASGQLKKKEHEGGVRPRNFPVQRSWHFLTKVLIQADPFSHPNDDQADKQQASAVAPEGTEEGEAQGRGEAVQDTKMI